MAVIIEGIRVEDNDKISFGNYEADTKIKAKVELNGDEYGVKTHDKVTRLEKNGTLLFEAVPGISVFGFSMSEQTVSFSVEGKEDTQITLELLPDCVYDLTVGGESAGSVQTNRSGKVNIGIEFDGGMIPVVLDKRG